MKLGRALKEGEYRAKVFLLNVKEEEVGCFIIMTMIKVFLDCTRSAYVRNLKITFFFFFSLIWSCVEIFLQIVTKGRCSRSLHFQILSEKEKNPK